MRFTKVQDIRVEFGFLESKVSVPAYRADGLVPVPVAREFVGEYMFDPDSLKELREFLEKLRESGVNVSEWSFRQIDLRSLIKDELEIGNASGVDPKLLLNVAEAIDYELGDNGNEPHLILRAAEEALSNIDSYFREVVGHYILNS